MDPVDPLVSTSLALDPPSIWGGSRKLVHFRRSLPRFWRHQSDRSCHM